jgi:hypothetical protein
LLAAGVSPGPGARQRFSQDFNAFLRPFARFDSRPWQRTADRGARYLAAEPLVVVGEVADALAGEGQTLPQ